MSFISSWDSLCKLLRDLPKKKDSLTKMSLSDLPRQEADANRSPPHVVDDDNVQISGREFNANAEEGEVEEIQEWTLFYILGIKKEDLMSDVYLR